MKNGRYMARAINACLGFDKNGGQKIEILFAILDANSKETGEEISYFGSFVGKGAAFTLEAMRTLGWEHGKELSSIRGVKEIEVYEEEYNGKMNQRVRILTPRKGLITREQDRMSPEQAKKFLARLGQPIDDDMNF